jgi:trk system potassium uptake protein TrkH
VLAVLNALGKLLLIFGAAYVPPVITSWVFADGTWKDFALAALLTSASGLLITQMTKHYRRELKSRDGFLLVALAWTLISAAAAIPLMVIADLSFTSAFFEALSGLSTTGATVLTGLDHLPPAVNLWRHALGWYGGFGFLVLAVAVLPLLGVGGMQLYKAETPGPIKDPRLTTRIMQTAKALWGVYVAITVLCIVALMMAGMPWFDAVCHAFAVLALTGFSTHDASIGYFHSPAVEAVLIVFMLIAAMNFSTHFRAWRGRSLKYYARDPEARWMLLLVLGSCVCSAVYLQRAGVYADFPTALRYASFNLVSLATDCGLVNTDYGRWPIFVPMWMLFLSCICASAGSTGGGIKMFRTLLLGRQALREMRLMVHPQAVEPMRIGAQVVPNRIAYAVLAFIFLYFMTVVVLVFAMLLSGLDFISSLSAVIASINNAGPGLGRVGPGMTYHSLSHFQIWVCSIAMLLGRLEIFSVLVLFTPTYWRK